MEMSDRENRSVMCGAGTDVRVEKVSRFPQERSPLCWELVPARRRWSRRASTGLSARRQKDEGDETQLLLSMLPAVGSRCRAAQPRCASRAGFP